MELVGKLDSWIVILRKRAYVYILYSLVCTDKHTHPFCTPL
jgi:hypothetical protein